MKIINKITKALYGSARTLRDVQAVCRTVETGSPKPLINRAAHKFVGPKYGKGMRKLTRWLNS